MKTRRWDTICFFIVIAALSFFMAKWAAEKLHDTNRLPEPAIVALLNNGPPVMIQEVQKPVLEENTKEESLDIDTLNRDIQKEAESLYSYRANKPILSIEAKEKDESDTVSNMFESDKPVFPEQLRLPPEKIDPVVSTPDPLPSLDVTLSDQNKDPLYNNVSQESNVSSPAFQKGFLVEGTITPETSTLKIAEEKNNTPAPSPFKNISQENLSAPDAKPIETVKTLKPVFSKEVNDNHAIQTEPKTNSDTVVTVVLESNELATPTITVASEPVKVPALVPVVSLPKVNSDQTVVLQEEKPVLVADPVIESEKPAQAKKSDQVSLSTQPVNSVSAPLDIWIVSSPCCQVNDVYSLHFQQWNNCQWQVSNFEQFVASNSTDVSNVIFIHGNWTDMEKAVNDGWYLKQRLQTMTDTGPIRLIIWKWNSEKLFRNIRQDSQFKAELADQDGKNLAVFLDSANMPGPVALIGFSFGARTIGSALVQTQVNTGEPLKNVLLVSAATDCYDFQPAGKYGSSLGKINCLINLYNPEDKALRFYPLLYGRGGCPALGTMPFCNNCLTPEFQGKLVSINTICSGKQHRFSRFMQCLVDAQFRTLIHR